jgi:hypothetical protein
MARLHVQKIRGRISGVCAAKIAGDRDDVSSFSLQPASVIFAIENEDLAYFDTMENDPALVRSGDRPSFVAEVA